MIKLISLFTLLLPLSLFAADEKSQVMVELLKDDVLSAKYTGECKGKEGKDMEACLWDGLDEKKQEEIRKKLDSLNSENKESKAKYDALDLSAGLKKDEKKEIESEKKKKDPAIAKLEEFLSKRLSESLYGDINDAAGKGMKVVDHKVFYDLYETQVSKSVISSISSYCIEAGPNNYISETETERVQQRKDNMALLEGFTASKDGKKQNNDAYNRWADCSQNIQNVCDKYKGKEKDYSGASDYTQKRACEVTKLIRNARQNLLKVAEIKKIMEENNKQQGVSVQTKKGQEVYSGAAEGKTKDIDELTTITSSDLAKSGFKEGNEEKKKLLEECKAAPPEDERCKQFFLSQKESEDSKKTLDEYALRTKALEEKLKSTDFNKEEVTTYLKEQGYEEADIKKLVEDTAKLEEIKTEIKKRYEKEREGLVAAMNEKLKQKTTKENETPADKQSKISELEKEIQNRPEEYKNLIHYNNVVAGFLSFKSDGTTESKGNTASIGRELSTSEGLSAEEQARNKTLAAKMEEKGVKLDTKSSQSVSLGVKEINQALLKIESATLTEPNNP